MSFKLQVQNMKKVYQIPGVQTVYDHGISVRKHLFDLIEKVQNSHPDDDEFKLQALLPYLYDRKTLSRYSLYHDIGKSVCFTKDEAG